MQGRIYSANRAESNICIQFNVVCIKPRIRVKMFFKYVLRFSVNTVRRQWIQLPLALLADMPRA